MRTATTYEIISITPKPEMKIPEKLQLILSHESIGNKFTISKILDKYDTSILSGYKTKEVAYNTLVNILSIAKSMGLVKTTHKSSIPGHFETLETVVYWQSQLRGSRFKHSEGKSSTRKQYLYHLWVFNKWLVGKQAGNKPNFVNNLGKRIKKVTIVNEGDSIKITPKAWIDKSVWGEINDILKLHEFGWLSSGKDSCWLKLLSN